MGKVYIHILLTLSLAGSAILFGTPVVAQTVIHPSVIGGGPTVALSGTTVVTATVGQGVIDLTQQGPYGVYQGFWGPAFLASLSVDAPPDWYDDATLQLSHASPNPFTSHTTAWISIAGPTHVVVTLLDGLGRELFRPIDDLREAGSHKVMIDGSALSSGIYYIRVSTANATRVTPITLQQ